MKLETAHWSWTVEGSYCLHPSRWEVTSERNLTKLWSLSKIKNSARFIDRTNYGPSCGIMTTTLKLFPRIMFSTNHFLLDSISLACFIMFDFHKFFCVKLCVHVSIQPLVSRLEGFMKPMTSPVLILMQNAFIRWSYDR